MRALWKGIKHGLLPAAMPAFFPEPAYLQVKAIADPAADWRSRLVGGYRVDLAAAHGLVAGGGHGAAGQGLSPRRLRSLGDPRNL